jgi:predicted O-methyltransferase YrrM
MKLVEIKEYAIEHDVPIMSDESLDFISSILNETNSRSLLEVGTAIAYSSLYIQSKLNDIKIVTLERDRDRFEVAQFNLENIDFDHNIVSIQTDALKYNNTGVFDAVVIDAAKAQNIAFLRLYFAFCDKVMIIDNIDFHGYTGKSSDIKNRRLRQMVVRIERFLKYLETRSDLVIEKIDIGDGLLVIRRREN